LFDHTPYSPDLSPSDYHLLTTWRTGWDHSASAIMRGVWKVWKSGRSHRWQTTLTQAYKNLFPDMINASITGLTTLKSMYVFFCI
jgi:hypothetical protein